MALASTPSQNRSWEPRISSSYAHGPVVRSRGEKSLCSSLHHGWAPQSALQGPPEKSRLPHAAGGAVPPRFIWSLPLDRPLGLSRRWTRPKIAAPSRLGRLTAQAAPLAPNSLPIGGVWGEGASRILALAYRAWGKEPYDSPRASQPSAFPVLSLVAVRKWRSD